MKDITKKIDTILNEKTPDTEQGWLFYNTYKKAGISWSELIDRLNKLGFKTKGLDKLVSSSAKTKDDAINKILVKKK